MHSSSRLTKKHGFNTLVDMSFYKTLAISLFFIIIHIKDTESKGRAILARPGLAVRRAKLLTELSTGSLRAPAINRCNRFQHQFKGLQ
jgi:hypothetical protein